MSSAKFYVLGGGRWRELDTSAGRVEGWGGARFLYVKRGRLQAVRRAPVLRGLRALAAGRSQTVRDGAPLSQIRHTKIVKATRAPCPPREPHDCCHHAHYGCGVRGNFDMRLQPVCAVHVPPPPAPPRTNKMYKPQNREIKNEMSVKKKQTEITEPIRENNVRPNSSDEDLSASIMEWNRKRKMRETRGAELCKELIIAEEDIVLLRNYIEKDEKNVFKVDLERFDADDTYKSKVFYKLNPLVNVERCKAIADMTWDRRSQSTVTLKDFITNLGLRRIDDPSPSRSSYRMRRRRDTRKPRENENEQDKENLASKRQPKVNKRSNKVLGESVGGKPNSDRLKSIVKVSEMPSRVTRGSGRPGESAVVEVSDSDSAFERPEPATSRAKTAAPQKRAAGGRDYSEAEDASIVRWLRAAGRGRLVNGNRLWRELQPEHQRLTGHFRSWHSLRNRYLRYVLPSLGALLPAPAAAELRAAAARGEIKERLPRRRHSLLALPPVLSAWARRPRPDRDGPLENISEPTRSLRSSGASVAVADVRAPAHVDTPTYSELTKRFAERRRSTPNSDASEVTELVKVERRCSKRLRTSRNADSSIRLEDASCRETDTSVRRGEKSSNNANTSDKQTTRSNRNADISTRQTNRSSKNANTSSRHTGNASQTPDSTDRRKPHTRRLYNPNL